MKYSIKNIYIAVIFLLSLAVSANPIMQNNEGIDNAAKKLQQKVLLNDEQTNKVKSILTKYVNNSDKYSDVNIQKEITAVMDARQSAKYEIIKANWWKEVEALLPKK
jgi:hypothetical protein